MAFPSNIGTQQDSLQVGWTAARNAAGQIKQRAIAVRDMSASGPVGSSTVLNLLTLLIDQRAILQRAAALSGMQAYAQEQLGNPVVDIATAFSAMITAMDAAGTWIIVNFPTITDGSGTYLAAYFWEVGPTGRIQDRQFDTASLGPLRTLLNNLILSID